MTKKEKAAYRMARYALHRSRGHCVRCPAASGKFVLCLACRLKDGVDSKRRRDRAKAARVLAQHKARKEAA
jgi:hypothetical protein